MDISTLIEVLRHPNDNGISVFILGVLFVLTVYHFMLYFQHKDKTYLYYSLYTFLIFISHIIDAPHSFFMEIIPENILWGLSKIDFYLVWSYNIFYFIFAFTFVDIRTEFKKWHKGIFTSVYLLFGITFFFEISYLLSDNFNFIKYGNLFFLAMIVPLAITSFIPLFKSKSQIKYYLITGALVLFITSITAELIVRLGLIQDGSEISYSIFYIGILIENMFFSLGLGQKQKQIIKEKETSQKKLILQLRENESLKEKINQQLSIEVNSLNKQVEIDRLDSINAKYEKELAELKVTLLRSQMNPHFIFNSLNSIKLYIINNEKENAVYYLNKFSKLIRKILASTLVKEVSLAEELETMELYMNIENIRFENKIEFTINIDDSINIETIKIPCMILQPLIENSIWHGLSSKKGSKKLQIILSRKQKKYVIIEIEDNGIGREAAANLGEKKIRKKHSLGLKLAKERLRNYYKSKFVSSSLKIIDLYDEDKHPSGTKVLLKIPLE